MVKVWDLRTLKCLDTLSLLHTGTIYDVVLHDDVIYTCSQGSNRSFDRFSRFNANLQDSTIRTWSNRTYNNKDTLGEVGGGQVNVVDLSPNN